MVKYFSFFSLYLIISGDTIYIPTGALHGAVNTDSDSLSLAYTSNFLDQEHAAQVLKEWCGDDLDRDSICYMLAKKDITSENGLFKDVLEKLELFEQEEKELNEEIMSGRVVDGDQKKRINQYKYWPWVLSHEGYCLKNAIDRCPGISDRCDKVDAEPDWVM